MTRITDAQILRNSLTFIEQNKENLARYQNEVSTGIRVAAPGDDQSVAATIAQLQSAHERYDGHEKRVSSLEGELTFQEGILSQAAEIFVRARELATQGANESLGYEERALLKDEVFQLRDHLVSLANSKYLGKYVFGGTDNDDPPFDAATYTVPASGPEAQRYVYDSDPGFDQTRDVYITDDLQVTVNTPGNLIFADGIGALERLGRALAGYRTGPNDAQGVPNGLPDGTGTAFTFPADYAEQTQDILETLDLIEDARDNDIITEQSSVAGRLKRLESAGELLGSLKTGVSEVLGRLQAADVLTSASLLTQAKTALEASLTVSARLLNLNILDYI